MNALSVAFFMFFSFLSFHCTALECVGPFTIKIHTKYNQKCFNADELFQPNRENREEFSDQQTAIEKAKAILNTLQYFHFKNGLNEDDFNTCVRLYGEGEMNLVSKVEVIGTKREGDQEIGPRPCKINFE